MRPSDSLKSWLGKTAQRYHEALTPEVLSYLESRGLDQDAVTGYRLGLVADPDPMHEAYRGRLSIPYITPTGVVTMRFRCLEDHDCRAEKCPKYTQPSGEETHLYNVQALHDADTVVGISEGELDAEIATLCGLSTVGIPGATNWKSHWYRLFDDFERVLVFGDGDTAGRSFASKLVHTIPGAEAKVMPEGMDVTSFYVESGKDAFLDFALS